MTKLLAEVAQEIQFYSRYLTRSQFRRRLLTIKLRRRIAC